MTKKKEAVLESKITFEQTEGSMYNYGGKYSIFAMAEKSGRDVYRNGTRKQVFQESDFGVLFK